MNGNLESADEILLAALGLPADQRTAFLDRHSEPNSELRIEVESLLAVADSSPHLLREPVHIDVPGRLGRYEILELVGTGGMGKVYRALDTTVDRDVAVKILPQPLYGSQDWHTNIEQEAKVLAQLSHGNIATLYTKEVEGELHYLTMEFVDGDDLNVLLERGPLEDPMAVCLDIARALAYAHEQGVVHLDIKPANVKIANNSVVKVLDFGISRSNKFHDPATSTSGRFQLSRPAGTPGYWSPEQRNSQEVDQRTDVWAFGWLLYECHLGRSSMPEEEQYVDGGVSLVYPAEFNPKLRTLIESCLRVDPEGRVERMAQVVEQLEDIADGTSSSLRQGANTTRSWSTVQRTVLAALLVTTAVAVMSQFSKATEFPTAIEMIGERRVRAVGRSGEILWTRILPGDIGGNTGYKGEAKITTVVEDEVIKGVALSTLASHEPSRLFYLDASNGKTLWSSAAKWDEPMGAGGPLQYYWHRAVRGPDGTEQSLLVALRDGIWYSCAYQLVSLSGEILGTYYHPGVLTPASPLGAGPGGGPPYMLQGANGSARFVRDVVPFDTEEHCGAVVLLNPEDFRGQAFPYATEQPEPRDWPSQPLARETAYLLIPPSAPGLDGKVNNIDFIQSDDGITGFTVQTNDGRTISLDSTLRPYQTYIGVRTPAAELGPDWKVPAMLHIVDGVATPVEPGSF